MSSFAIRTSVLRESASELQGSTIDPDLANTVNIPLNSTLTWNGAEWTAVSSGEPMVQSRITIPTRGTTFKKESLPLNSGNTVKTSGVKVELDNAADTSQTFTFGPATTNIWVAAGQGTTHSLAYSYDGIGWTGLGKPFSPQVVAQRSGMA